MTFSNQLDKVRCAFHDAKIMKYRSSEVDNSKKCSQPQVFGEYGFELNVDQRIYLNGIALAAKQAVARFPKLFVDKGHQLSSKSDVNDSAKDCDITVRQVLSCVSRFIEDGNVLFNKVPLTWKMLTVSSITFLTGQTDGYIEVIADINYNSEGKESGINSDSLEIFMNHDCQVVKSRIICRRK